MSIADEARTQLATELGARLWALGVLDSPDEVIRAARRAEGMAARTAPALASDDDREAAQATIDVLCALWPGAVPAAWWATPVGRLCARSLGDDPEAVTHSVAAAMLGVTRGTIATWVHRGDLARHPDGGVLRGSVMARLAR